ncbi:MAG: GNAT family N-acetyltransferase [Proteobacteria bacterium]|nr:GNAT family N-acetyltransferase [Pseudomonadota bacterium]MBS0572743.1 GNAT family N-acetyltransferase [Pseudomonadota bacterium]
METERKVGWPVPDWRAPPPPAGEVLEGRLVRLEPLSAPRHAADLHEANRTDDRIWDYLPYGPFATAAEYAAWAEGMSKSADPKFYAIVTRPGGRAEGVASYLRITPAVGTIEVGHICLSPRLQGTVAATEAMFLMMDWAFARGYRRYEWKCDALNLPSRRAAERFGFSYEGTFRQATIYKGRNRDTAWFAMVDRDWPGLQRAYRTWLDPANFDAAGRQRQRLSDLTRPCLVSRDPVAKGA